MYSQQANSKDKLGYWKTQIIQKYIGKEEEKSKDQMKKQKANSKMAI